MQNKTNFSKVICNKCGKEAPIDKDKSTENWVAYKVDVPCECGGEFVPDFILKMRRKEK